MVDKNIDNTPTNLLFCYIKFVFYEFLTHSLLIFIGQVGN